MAHMENPWNCNNFQPSSWRPIAPVQIGRLVLLQSTHAALYNVPPSQWHPTSSHQNRLCAMSTEWNLFPSTVHVTLLQFVWMTPWTSKKRWRRLKKALRLQQVCFCCYTRHVPFQEEHGPMKRGNRGPSNHRGDQYCACPTQKQTRLQLEYFCRAKEQCYYRWAQESALSISRGLSGQIGLHFIMIWHGHSCHFPNLIPTP